MTLPFRASDKGLRIRFKVTPRAGRDSIRGLGADADGQSHLKVSLCAAPVGGKANRALIELLAREWGVAKTAISVVAGATARHKVVEIRGSADALSPRLSAWLDRMMQQE